ncbi:MAG: Gfo/Idh/MocA family oxidoreductase [Bdellovibrionales bacterium]|nr:Gfo/Idh/MocA family oxidoreductase [Bdellovibrionales bacterium]
MRITVVGYGSIGQRHARLAIGSGHDVCLVTAQNVEGFMTFKDLPTAIHEFRPNTVIIANETHIHANTLKELRRLGFSDAVMLEKPVGVKSEEFTSFKNDNTFVGYNLRFHPVVSKIRSAISGQNIISISLYVGQNLTKWQPERDYRMSYRAKKETGGGVLRDLSHEIDLLIYLVGPIKRVSALVGKKSGLEIQTEDCACVLAESVAGTFVTFEVNYIDHTSNRYLNVNTDSVSARGNLISGELVLNGVTENYQLDRDTTYALQLKSLLSDQKGLCTLDEGLQTLSMIEAIEKSAKEESWIQL